MIGFQTSYLSVVILGLFFLDSLWAFLFLNQNSWPFNVQRSTLGSTFSSRESPEIIFDDISCGFLNSNSGSTSAQQRLLLDGNGASLDAGNYSFVWLFIDLAVVVLRITFSISKNMVITRVFRVS